MELIIVFGDVIKLLRIVLYGSFSIELFSCLKSFIKFIVKIPSRPTVLSCSVYEVVFLVNLMALLLRSKICGGLGLFYKKI